MKNYLYRQTTLLKNKSFTPRRYMNASSRFDTKARSLLYVMYVRAPFIAW